MIRQRVAFAVPGAIETRTGGYIYGRRVIENLRCSGWRVDHVELPASFPHPADADVAASLALLNSLEPGIPVIIDGLAWGALPHAAARRVRGPVVALCHHPLALESGLTDAAARYFRANEKDNLALAVKVVVSSATTRATLIEDFAVMPDRIIVAEPGTDRVARARGSQDGGTAALFTAGSLIARKGYDVLIEALSRIRFLPWRLRIAGSPDRAPKVANALRELIDARDLQQRVLLLGEVDDDALAREYDGADMFVMSSHYEGYGMVLAEAMAHGLAIVATTGGAAAATVPDDAAIKTQPGDADALAAALRRMIEDRALRRCLADASWRAGQNLPQWSDTAATIARALLELQEHQRQ